MLLNHISVPSPPQNVCNHFFFALITLCLILIRSKRKSLWWFFCLIHLVSRSRRSLSKHSLFFNAKWFHRFVIIHANCVKSYFVHHGNMMMNGDSVSYACTNTPSQVCPQFCRLPQPSWIVPSFVLQRSRNLYSTVHHICQEGISVC